MLNLSVKHTNHAQHYAKGMETMGDRIKLLRQARNLTQEQVAKACGITKSAVSQWENGLTSSIKLPTVLALVDVLRTDLAYLVYGADRHPGAGAGGRMQGKA
jgi:transcriptional regulator with XRE-family HTH domain